MMELWSITEWFRAFAPIFTAVAAIGSVLAVIFFWLNLVQMKKQLREMQEQKALEYKGLLIIHLTGIGYENDQLVGYYQFKQSRVPLLLKGMKWGISMSGKIEIDSQCERLRGDIGDVIKSPVVTDENCFVKTPLLPKVKDFFEDH